MNSTVSRGRLIFVIAVALLILERLLLAGLALANLNNKEVNWTAVLLPLTHIAVVLFLAFTSDMLIYWLVIMWGIITTGHFSWQLWTTWRTIHAKDNTIELSRVLSHNWLVVVLVVFHLMLTLAFLMPAVRAYLASQRSKLDFEDVPAAPTSSNEERKNI
ncbi:MAG TPA: hypothetical protein PLN21_15590 [Gemmatales bacterium]|nr:hypothetical protein [Gemmatales bacterium]